MKQKKKPTVKRMEPPKMDVNHFMETFKAMSEKKAEEEITIQITRFYNQMFGHRLNKLIKVKLKGGKEMSIIEIIAGIKDRDQRVIDLTNYAEMEKDELKRFIELKLKGQF